MPRGRKPGYKMPEEHRAKIENSKILRHLIEHVEGLRDMSQTQVTAGIALLRKCLPDLSSSEQKIEQTVRYVARIPEKQPDAVSWQAQHSQQATTQH